MLAEKFEIGLGFLARGDIGQGDLRSRPVALVPRQYRELQIEVQFGTVERVIDDLALVEQVAVPELDELFLEVPQHLVAEDQVEIHQQGLAILRAEQLQRLAVEIDDTDLAHASFYKVGMHIHEGAEILDAPMANFFEKAAYGAEILDPERNRRVFKQSARMGFADDERSSGFLPLGDVFDGDEDPRPAVLVARQDGPPQFDVETRPVQRIVGGLAGEFRLAVPELAKLLGMGLEHVVAENAVEVFSQDVDGLGAIEGERLAVDLDDLDQSGTLGHTILAAPQIVAQVLDAVLPQSREVSADLGIVLQPQGYRRKVEHAGIGVIAFIRVSSLT